jgi:hypothetical protein
MINRSTFFVLALCLFAAPLAAQTIPGTDDPDFKEVVAYQLTMPRVQKMMQATRNFAEAIKNDPRFKRQQAIEAELDKLREKEEPSEADGARIEKLEAELEQLENSTGFGTDNNNRTLSELAAAMNKEPLIAKALASAGVDAREYAKFMLAYMQAGMVHGMMKSGMVKEVPKNLAASVNMDNVKFIAEHEQELEALMKEFEKLKPQK